ncbi:DNA repair-related protein, partial [Striga asiatica]
MGRPRGPKYNRLTFVKRPSLGKKWDTLECSDSWVIGWSSTTFLFAVCPTTYLTIPSNSPPSASNPPWGHQILLTIPSNSRSSCPGLRLVEDLGHYVVVREPHLLVRVLRGWRISEVKGTSDLLPSVKLEIENES